jgi:hypothetical protein
MKIPYRRFTCLSTRDIHELSKPTNQGASFIYEKRTYKMRKKKFKSYETDWTYYEVAIELLRMENKTRRLTM